MPFGEDTASLIVSQYVVPVTRSGLVTEKVES